MTRLNWLFKLTNHVSGPATDMGKALKGMDAVLKKVDGSSKTLTGVLRKNFGLSERAAAGLVRGVERLGAASRALSTLNKRAEQARQTFGRWKQTLTGLAVGGLVIGGAVALAGKGLIDQVGFIEQQRIALETLLKDPIRGRTTLDWSIKFADKTPFEIPEVLDSVRLSLAMGFKTTQVEKLLTTLGDTASLTGSRMQDLVMVFGQIKGAGKATTEDLNQLAERGIGAWAYLAKGLGKSTGEVRKQVEKGAIDSATAINILVKAMKQDFGGGMEKQARSIFGLVSTLKSRPQSLAFKLETSGAADPIRKLLANLVDLTDFSKAPGNKIGQQLEGGISRLFKVAFGPLASATEPEIAAKKIGEFVNRATEFVSRLQQAWPVALAAWEQFAGGVKSGLAVLQGVGNVVSPILVLLARLTGGTTATQASIGGMNVSGLHLIGMLLTLVTAWRVLNTLTLGGAGYIARYAAIAGGVALKAVLGLGRAFLVALGPIGWVIGLITLVGAGLVLLYKRVPAFRAFVDNLWAGIKKMLTNVISFMASLPQRMVQAGADLVNGIINGITSRWEALRSTVSNLASGAVGWFKGLLGIHSPSRVFAGMGQMLPRGLEVGIRSGAPGVSRSVGALAQATTLSMNPASLGPNPVSYSRPAVSVPTGSKGKPAISLTIQNLTVSGQNQAEAQQFIKDTLVDMLEEAAQEVGLV